MSDARHLLSIRDLSDGELRSLINRSVEWGTGKVTTRPLQSKVVGILFTKTSTRTRTAFTSGALRLGAQAISFGPSDLQTNTGETIEDTGRVLSGYLDVLVVRTNEDVATMRALASKRMAVINAMSRQEHPTQGLTDLSTMQEHFGSLEGLRVLYLGEGNNSTSALALALARFRGTRLDIFTPAGYGMDMPFMSEVARLAKSNGSSVEQRHSMTELPSQVDVVYTTRWQTMGVPKKDPDWKKYFLPFSVTQELMRKVSHAKTVFMHDLPAVRGDDVHDEVLDGPQSIAFRQAEHKMFSAMSALEWCVTGRSN